MAGFDEFPYHVDRIPKDIIEKEAFFENLKKQFIEEIENSEKAKLFLSAYNDQSAQSFINDYAKQKIQLIEYYRNYYYKYHEREEFEFEFRDQAENMLNAIQQKKLFNLQLKWRAGSLNIPGIDICYDFEYWGKYVMDCPFIPMVEYNEVELMKSFLLQLDWHEDIERYSFDDWQEYDVLARKDDHDDYQNLPEWYKYFDAMRGTGILLLLPDVKGKKEDYYFEICQKKNEKENTEPSGASNYKPFLSIYGEDFYLFADLFETDKYIRRLVKYKKYAEDFEEEMIEVEYVERMINMFKLADRTIHFPSHLKWDDAIRFAVRKYVNTKVAEAMDMVYDEYKRYKDLGIKKEETEREIRYKRLYADISEMNKKRILEGRELCGEPRDFNY
jgi:hypothetical protein